MLVTSIAILKVYLIHMALSKLLARDQEMDA